jgi:two-component system sensor histidine kinase and response regulator WspE
MVRELSQLQRLAEDLGPRAQVLAARLGKAKELAAEMHRDQKLLANEELRDLTQLSEEVQVARMLPLGVLFEEYPRMVRELARELGKEVELKIEGEDTKVDRSVLDALKDPLLHLVRNALDHGLEPRTDRTEAGKPPRGKVTLRARREGERLVLAVEDDGRGLDPARLRTAAVRKGLVALDEAERLSDPQAMDLIFLSGFSSKDAVTDVSGRGVGLDVVRVRMASMAGEVTVDSRPGQGSTFELRVPVSLAVAPLLFVGGADAGVCLSAANVPRVLTVARAGVRPSAGRPGLKVEDQVVPFTTLASVLGAAPERVANEGELVLLVHGRGQTAAVGIDRVLAERVQAVLPLRGLLANYAHLSGATPMADGTLAFVLSAVHLVASAQGAPVRLSTLPRRAPEAKRRRILVVDDSPLTRELLSSLLEAVGYDIVTAGDGLEAMDRLGKEAVEMVVSDLEMPNMDGLELTRRVKSHPTLRNLPVIIVTTRGSDQDRKRGMDAGADGYITKGDLVRQDLVDVVSRLLA